MSQPRYLTKTRFKLAVQCPTKLFYTGKKDTYRDTLAMVMVVQGWQEA